MDHNCPAPPPPTKNSFYQYVALANERLLSREELRHAKDAAEEVMGGEIAVRSRKGRGSVFAFTLPLEAAEEQIAALAESQPNGAAEQPSAGCILLAEDEPMIREMITTMLAHYGWQTEIAESGSEAVQKWEEGSFDIILMDLQMPGMNGIEATRSIRQREGEKQKRTCIIGKDLYTAIDTCLSK